MGAQRSRRKNEKQAASAAKKRREPKPKRWPVGAALLDAVLNKKGKESSSAGPNPKALLNSLTRVAIALYTPVKPNQDGFKMMYLRLIGADGKQALPETFNTILSTLTYSWHDTDPWAILGKSIWEGAEVGLDRAFYEFHREMSRLYTWKASSSAGKIAPWRFPLEFLKPVVDVYRERVVALRNQHMGLHIAKAQMREHLRRLQVEVVGPELLRAYQGSGKPMPPWASEEKVGLRRTYTFLKEHIPVGAELLMPVVPLAPGAFESDEDEVPMKGNVDDDDDIGDIEDSDKEDHHHHHHHHHHNRYKGGYEDVDRLKGDNMEFQYMESDRGPGHPLTALEVLVKTATADSISGSDDFDDSGGLFSS